MQKLQGGRFQLERMKIFAATRNMGETEGGVSQVKFQCLRCLSQGKGRLGRSSDLGAERTGGPR